MINGIIIFEDVFGFLVCVLIEYLNLFIDLIEVVKVIEVMKEIEKVNDEKVFDWIIEEFDLLVCLYNCLKCVGINIVFDLIEKIEFEMMKVWNLGCKSFEEVKIKFVDLGFGLKNDK